MSRSQPLHAQVRQPSFNRAALSAARGGMRATAPHCTRARSASSAQLPPFDHACTIASNPILTLRCRKSSIEGSLCNLTPASTCNTVLSQVSDWSDSNRRPLLCSPAPDSAGGAGRGLALQTPHSNSMPLLSSTLLRIPQAEQVEGSLRRNMLLAETNAQLQAEQ